MSRSPLDKALRIIEQYEEGLFSKLEVRHRLRDPEILGPDTIEALIALGPLFGDVRSDSPLSVERVLTIRSICRSSPTPPEQDKRARLRALWAFRFGLQVERGFGLGCRAPAGWQPGTAFAWSRAELDEALSANTPWPIALAFSEFIRRPVKPTKAIDAACERALGSGVVWLKEWAVLLCNWREDFR